MAARLGSLLGWLPFDTAAIVRNRQPYPRACQIRTPRDVTRQAGLSYDSLLQQVSYQCFSQLRRNVMPVQDVDPAIAAFTVNTRGFNLPRDFARVRDAPPFQVLTSAGSSAFVSVRPAHGGDRLEELLSAIEAACRAHRVDHVVFDGTLLESRFARNCRLLRAAADVLHDDMVLAAAEAIVRVPLPGRLGDLLRSGCADEVAFLGLAAFRILELELGGPIGRDAIVRRGARW